MDTLYIINVYQQFSICKSISDVHIVYNIWSISW